MIKAEVIFVKFTQEDRNGTTLPEVKDFDSILEAKDFVKLHNGLQMPKDYVGEYVKAYYNGCKDV